MRHRRWKHGFLSAAACAVMAAVCLLAAAGCSQPKEPPIPPGMVRVQDQPLRVNTPALTVKARISAPFPEEPGDAAAELDAALLDMGLDMEAPMPETSLTLPTEQATADVIPGPEAETAPTEPADVSETAQSPGTSEELAALRSDIARMQAMLDLVLDEFVIELKNENNRLREEVDALKREIADMEARDAAPLAMGRLTPPSADDGEFRPPEAPVVDYTEVAEPEASGPIRYAVIKEWGRDAEAAARLNDASTLKGMICAVPPDASDAQLAELGRWLRQEYADFDNLNIEVFDEVAAARQFVETNRADGGHRVLTISKHPATNLDSIVLIRGGSSTVISPDETP